MTKIGIITIHRIKNYGSVLQAYALQQVCESLGYVTEIIDYKFPNVHHLNNKYAMAGDSLSKEPSFNRLLFAAALMRQHNGIARFVNKYQHLSSQTYNSPEELLNAAPRYDVYITGSDQVWSPRHCNGDPSFMLHFAPAEALKISYASSIGAKSIPEELHFLYKESLRGYRHIGVRENSAVELIREVAGKEATVVLDPTLLLNMNEWNKIASSKRLMQKKYVLCYFLNYSFNAFPYADQFAEYIRKQTGYEIVYVARPPHNLKYRHTHYRVGASPEEFLALIRDAEMILTTSFHGTAFAVNYGKPVFTIVQDRNAGDSRQVSLMSNLGLEAHILSITDSFPSKEHFFYDVEKVQKKLDKLRRESKQFLINALRDE